MTQLCKDAKMQLCKDFHFILYGKWYYTLYIISYYTYHTRVLCFFLTNNTSALSATIEEMICSINEIMLNWIPSRANVPILGTCNYLYILWSFKYSKMFYIKYKQLFMFYIKLLN